MSEAHPLRRGGLPIVSAETVGLFYAVGTASPEDYGQRLNEFKLQLIAENSQLCLHIEAEVSKYPPELHQLVFGSIASTLMLLQDQAIADYTNDTFEEPPES